MSGVRRPLNPMSPSEHAFTVVMHLPCRDVRFNRSYPDQKAKKEDPKVNFGV